MQDGLQSTIENSPPKGFNRRLIIGAFVIVLAITYLMVNGLRDNATYYLEINEVLAQSPTIDDQRIRMGGKVLPGSISIDTQNLIYDFQIHQIAAYAATHWGAEAVENGEVQGANCYISSTEPGRFEVCGYSPPEITEAWETFKDACSIWRSLKGYDPRRGA